MDGAHFFGDMCNIKYTISIACQLYAMMLLKPFCMFRHVLISSASYKCLVVNATGDSLTVSVTDSWGQL